MVDGKYLFDLCSELACVQSKGRRVTFQTPTKPRPAAPLCLTGLKSRGLNRLLQWANKVNSKTAMICQYPDKYLKGFD